MAQDINKKPFDEETQLKLDIFRDCFKEWLPVFIHDPYTEEVYIYDFFAGSGKDSESRMGSPLILLDEGKGKDMRFCSKVKKKVHFVFNEQLKYKYEELQKNVQEHISLCEQENCGNKCVYSTAFERLDFRNFFETSQVQNVLKNRNFGKFLLLDQYGFKQIDDDLFKKLINFPKTDFIFFITSSFVNRFKSQKAVKDYFEVDKLDFKSKKAGEVHRIIADYFRSLIPKNKEYYLHHFSIQKDTSRGNYYGLIFGSNHTLGMEKFIKVCWSKDPNSGESNHNVDYDYNKSELFYNEEESNKKTRMKEELEQKLLSGEIKDNISGLKYTLKNGCEPKLFTFVVKDLESKKKIERFGAVNNSSTSIHKAKKYSIKLI